MINPDDVMVDIETLSTRTDAHILSIGACTMDTESSFYRTVGVQDRHIDFDTVRWWLKQSSEAQDVFNHCVESEPLSKVLEDFKNWLTAVPKVNNIWSHGATFDIVILTDAMLQSNIEVPWAFWQARDTRTLIDVAVQKFRTDFKPPREGIHHNALDDALFQAEWMNNINEALKHL